MVAGTEYRLVAENWVLYSAGKNGNVTESRIPDRMCNLILLVWFEFFSKV